MSFFENTRKPTGLGGKMMVSMMNIGHRSLADWGLRFVGIPTDATVLDCGCGGGANIAKLLEKCPKGKVYGIDYSEVSVEKSLKVNRNAVKEGRCGIFRASADELPFEDARFDLITAFETVYFWQELTRCFCEIYRVMKQGGTFFICNECNGDNRKDDKWTEMIDGMRIYNEDQLRSALEQAGFCNICAHKNEKGWICVTARKSV